MGDYLNLKGGPVHWKDYGGMGLPLVMVHGLGGSIANWDAIGSRLATHARAVAVDLPGFGLTPPREDWSLETHAGAVIETIAHFGGPAILVGNSLGALLCEIVAATRPELVEALILISPAVAPRFPDSSVHWPTARRLALNATPAVGTAISRYMIERLTPRELIEESLQRITHKPGRVPPHLVEAFVEIAERRRCLPWAADAIPKTGRSISKLILNRPRLVAMIREIKAPTLVVHGVSDHIVSPNAVAWLASLRLDWALVQMDDTGHTPQIDAPVRLLSIVEPWLESHLKHRMTA